MALCAVISYAVDVWIKRAKALLLCAVLVHVCACNLFQKVDVSDADASASVDGDTDAGTPDSAPDCDAADPSCDCIPESDDEFCARLQLNCGEVSDVDNCGETRTAVCGTCEEPTTCGASERNVCGCSQSNLCDFFDAECDINVSSVCPDVDSAVCGVCPTNNECTEGQCEPTFTETVAPTEIDGDASCVTTGWLTRHIALDAANALYAAFVCDGTVRVARSTDAGGSWETPVDTGATGATAPLIALAGGEADHVYLASVDSGEVSFSFSEDAGATWSDPVSVGTGATAWVSVHAFEGTVFVAHASVGTMTVHRDAQGGTGTFESVEITMSSTYGELDVDHETGEVWVMGDNPMAQIARSTDDGQTFEAPQDPGATIYYSDWAVGGGEIFGFGATDIATGAMKLYAIAEDDPATTREITGFEDASQAQFHAVCAASDGTAYGLLPTADGLALHRVQPLAEQADPAILIDAAGTEASCAAAPNGQVAIVYDAGGEVYATVQTLPEP